VIGDQQEERAGDIPPVLFFRKCFAPFSAAFCDSARLELKT